MLTDRRSVLAAALAGVLAGACRAARADAYQDLFGAITRDDAKEVRALMLKGVGTNSPDPAHGPAIVYAARIGSFQAMRALLESPLTDANIRSSSNETALMYTAMAGQVDASKALVARGAQVNKPGWTPLHYAVIGGSVEMVGWLLDQDAYIDAESPNGTTPLMLSAREGRKDIARLLVERGADPLVRNDAGLTAVDYFERAGDRELAAWMRERARDFASKYGTRQEPVPAPAR